MTTTCPPTSRETSIFNLSARKLACVLVLLCLALPIAASAQTFTNLTQFDRTDGASPYGRLAEGSDHNFYGTTQFGGAYGQGAVYKVTPAGVLTAIYSFCNVSGCTDGGQPFAGLTLGFDQNLYGVTGGTVFSITTAGDLTTLYRFCSQPNCTDGTSPFAPLIQASGGDFYGTTAFGGVATYQCGGGCGTIFKITPTGVLTTLYNFRGKDGYAPFDALVIGTDGNFYGTTSRGGAHDSGTVFRITPQGALTLLHSFTGVDGAGPYGSLIQATDGNFYGTTTTGGLLGYGVVYKITSAGKFTLLRNFNYTNGSTPYNGLVQFSDGNFYGTTYGGGSGTNCIFVCGTVFRVTPTGRLTTLYNFCSQSGCPDGSAPYAALTQGSDGNLYGATLDGGSAYGTIFKFSLVP